MGQDRAKAFEAARKLNAIFIPGSDLVARVIEPTETISDAIKLFRDEEMPGRNWGKRTNSLYQNILGRMSSAIGKREVAGFAIRDCAVFMTVRVSHIALLLRDFKCAVFGIQFTTRTRLVVRSCA